MISTFVIFLREGVEASMIIAILLAYLDQSGHREQFKHIYAGVISALVLVALGGVGAYLFVRHYDGSRVQTIFETGTYLVAAVALCYTTFWMQSHARTISSELRAKEEAALASGSHWSLTMLAFTAVGREGLETMVFTLAIIFASSGQAVTPVHGPLLIVGATLGLAVALVVAFLIYKLGRKLKLAVFFRVLGLALVLFAAGLIALYFAWRPCCVAGGVAGEAAPASIASVSRRFRCGTLRRRSVALTFKGPILCAAVG